MTLGNQASGPLTPQVEEKAAAPETFAWERSGEFEDVLYETLEGIAKITINRPEVRNAFRPKTVLELIKTFDMARDDPKVGVVILTGAGSLAFCSGGDQRVRIDDG
ncbi:hypothetical protein BH23ACT12_BH23ACT12_05460 [soil metagenome]